MPYANLVKNKQFPTAQTKARRQSPVLGVYEGVTADDIVEFVKGNKNIKIATTFNSLKRVIDALLLAGIDVYNDVFLLVDE
jgi:hypothetical protein